MFQDMEIHSMSFSVCEQCMKHLCETLTIVGNKCEFRLLS